MAENYLGLSPFEASYLETALWSSMDVDGIPLDSPEYSVVEPSDVLLARIKADCDAFRLACQGIIDPDTREHPVAHDFWLTRNRHGAGFWDGDYPEPLASQLTELAHSFGECELYVQDGRIEAE